MFDQITISRKGHRYIVLMSGNGYHNNPIVVCDTLESAKFFVQGLILEQKQNNCDAKIVEERKVLGRHIIYAMIDGKEVIYMIQRIPYCSVIIDEAKTQQ